MATQIKIRRDTYANWFNVNPTLANGEPGYDITNRKLKIGDGVTLWRALSYFDDQVIDINAFGSGFSLNAANKIVTNKLYSTDGTNPNQNYSLTLDSNGVVNLPNGTLIGSFDSPNGIDIKATNTHDYAQLNYNEDQYVWITSAGAYVGTNWGAGEGAAKVWEFNKTGTLTVAGTITKGDNLTLTSLGTESGNVAAVVADGDNGRVFIRTDNGIITKTWEFDINGNLKLPAGGDILDSAGASVLGGGSGSGNSSVTTGTTPPVGPALGDLWYDTNSGRTYIYYDSNWIDSNPPVSESISLTVLKSLVADSTDFADFQTRIAAL